MRTRKEMKQSARHSMKNIIFCSCFYVCCLRHWGWSFRDRSVITSYSEDKVEAEDDTTAVITTGGSVETQGSYDRAVGDVDGKYG